MKMDQLSPQERKFVNAIPERFRQVAFLAYKDYKNTAPFANIFERSKMCNAFMVGVVTAIHMTSEILAHQTNMDIDSPKQETEEPKKDEPAEESESGTNV